jgi:hypothetical protein
MAQRGFADDDLELIRWIGTEVEGGYLVREKDFQALDRAKAVAGSRQKAGR